MIPASSCTTAGVVVDAGLFVLLGMKADAHSEDEAASTEALQRRRLLGDDRRQPQWELQDAGPERRLLGGRGSQHQGGQALEVGAVPEEVVTSPQGPGTEPLGIRTDGRQGSDGIEIGSRAVRRRRPGKWYFLGKGRQNESDRPNGSGGSLHDHNGSYTPEGPTPDMTRLAGQIG